MRDCVVALIIRDQRILLGRRSPTRDFYPNVWDLFGGHVEPGERQHEALIRELGEELDIRPTTWTYLQTSQSQARSATAPTDIICTG